MEQKRQKEITERLAAINTITKRIEKLRTKAKWHEEERLKAHQAILASETAIEEMGQSAADFLAS